ncbi:MAG: response regulator [Thermodesulfovibrionales bacterium]|nr:response regulator [Thermodesulfovibrionales bacterium]
MSDRNPKERREKKRFPIQGNILIDGKIAFQCMDISEDGMYLYTGRSLEENRVVQVTLPIKGKPLTVKAQIRHNEPGIGIGLQFMDMTDEQKKTIYRLVHHVREHSVDAADRKRNILLIDENAISRQIYKNTLLHEGFFVFEAKEAGEAHRILKETLPDLILFDLSMEAMDGYEFLSILRENPAWKKIPVVIFSAVETPEVKERVITGGADVLLIKMKTTPFLLADTIRKTLQQHSPPL